MITKGPYPLGHLILMQLILKVSFGFVKSALREVFCQRSMTEWL